MDMKKRNKNIARLYSDEKLTLEEVGGYYGITRERVRQILVHMGITDRHNGKTLRQAEREKLAIKAYIWRKRNSATNTQTAKHFNINRNYLNYILHEADLTTPIIAPEHGSQAYNNGCRCDICKTAHNERMKVYVSRIPTYPNRPWNKKDEKFLLENYNFLGPTKIGQILLRSASACSQHYRRKVRDE